MIPDKYAVGLDSEQFARMRDQLDAAIKAMFPRMTARHSDKGKITLTINFTAEDMEVGDINRTRNALMPSISYKLGWNVECKGSEKHELIDEPSEVKVYGGELYIVPMQEQVSLFDEEEVEVNG